MVVAREYARVFVDFGVEDLGDKIDERVWALHEGAGHNDWDCAMSCA